jgi:hypothetical protein
VAGASTRDDEEKEKNNSNKTPRQTCQLTKRLNYAFLGASSPSCPFLPRNEPPLRPGSAGDGEQPRRRQAAGVGVPRDGPPQPLQPQLEGPHPLQLVRSPPPVPLPLPSSRRLERIGRQYTAYGCFVAICLRGVGNLNCRLDLQV